MPKRRESGADAAHLEKLRDVSYEPIFIIGDHRSGTTLLYQLLASSGAFNITTTYHVIGYPSLVAHALNGSTEEAKEHLNQRFRDLNLTTRVIDEMELNADTPEEYGIILHSEAGKLILDDESLPAFDLMSRKLQFISGHPDRPLLLKNPWDYPNFWTIRRLFPEAKMIFIHRHPVDTINSQLKAMRQNWHEGNPYIEMLSDAFAHLQRHRVVRPFMRWVTDPHSRVRLGQRMVTRRARASMNYYLRNIEKLAPSRYISVKYESLCADATSEIERILAFLGVHVPAQDYQGQIAPRPVRLLPGLEADAAKFDRIFRPLYERHDYQPVSSRLTEGPGGESSARRPDSPVSAAGSSHT